MSIEDALRISQESIRFEHYMRETQEIISHNKRVEDTLKAISHENAPHTDSIPGKNTMTPTHGFTPSPSPNTGAPYYIPLVDPDAQHGLAPLIGLGGKLRAGKDAVGDYLEAEHGYTKLGMSDALNEALLVLNPIIRVPDTVEDRTESRHLGQYQRYQDLHDRVGYVEAKKNPEVRRLLQALGTEVGREMIDPDVWVDIAVRKIQELRAQGKPVVITAVRFPNEVEMINRLGGTTIWIHRDDSERLNGTGVGKDTGDSGRGRENGAQSLLEHASETSVQPHMFEYVLWNDDTLDALYEKVDYTLDQVEQVRTEAIARLKNLGGHELPNRFGG